MRPLFYFFIFSFFYSVTLSAQLDLPIDFIEKLKAANVEFSQPLENSYQSRPISTEKYMPFDMAMWSNKEKLEIRYTVQAHNGTMGLYKIPQIESMTMLTNVATNKEELSDIAIHSIPRQGLLEQFNADWGMTAFFKPKESFSRYTYCKMIALYKENQGMIYIFYLFDNPANEALDYRVESVRFY